MVKKVITNLDLSKMSGPDCILVVFPKNCEPKLLYIIAELFSIYVSEGIYVPLLLYLVTPCLTVAVQPCME